MFTSTLAIARRLGLVLLVAAPFCFAAAETILDRLAKLSSSLSDSNASSALDSFDSSMKEYGELSKNIDALTAQTDIVCAIDIINETEADGVHKLDTDWILQLKSKADHGPFERRRERIQLEMRQVKKKWKISAISMPEIFSPLRVP